MKRIISLIIFLFLMVSMIALSSCDLLPNSEQESTDDVSDENQNGSEDSEDKQGDTADNNETPSENDTNPETPSDDNVSSEIGGALYTFSADKSYCVLTGVKDVASVIIIIPNELSGVPITEIGYSAFADAEGLKEIIIPDSILAVGINAFASCNDLESIYYLGSEEQLTRLMSNVAEGNSAFTSAKVYIYSETQPEVEGDFWRYVDGVPTVWPKYQPHELAFVLVDGDDPYYIVTGIGTYVGSDVVIPSTYKDYPVCEISKNAFCEFPDITSISIPDSVISIGDRAFAECTGLTSVIFANGVASIGNSAFYDCTSLVSTVIPESVTNIGEAAFYNCTSLTSVTIPESVTGIGNSAFYNCTGLVEINFDAKELDALSIDSNVFYNAGADSTGIAVNIGANVTNVPDYLFCNATGIVTVEFAEEVCCTSIGK